MKKEKKKKLIKKTIKKKKPIKKRKKLRGIIHYCSQCKKKTEHNKDGNHYIDYTEKCKLCNQINYSEILRKD